MPQGFAPRKQSSENDSCCSVPYYGPVPPEERLLFFPQKLMSAPATTRFCVSTGCKTHALLYNSALPAEGTVSGCTHDGVVVQLVRISACHVEGRGFESRPLRQSSFSYPHTSFLLFFVNFCSFFERLRLVIARINAFLRFCDRIPIFISFRD